MTSTEEIASPINEPSSESAKIENPSKEKEKEKEKRIHIVDITGQTASGLKFTRTLRCNVKIDGQNLQGDFVVKRPTILDVVVIENKAADLRRERHPSVFDSRMCQIHDAIATLSVCVTKSPDWWDIDNWYDVEFLLNLYGEVALFWSNFPKAV